MSQEQQKLWREMRRQARPVQDWYLRDEDDDVEERRRQILIHQRDRQARRDRRPLDKAS